MGIKKGRLVVCDHCGRVKFDELKLYLSDALPEYVSKEEGWRYGYLHEDNVTLCPYCYSLFKNGYITGVKNVEGRYVKIEQEEGKA